MVKFEQVPVSIIPPLLRALTGVLRFTFFGH